MPAFLQGQAQRPAAPPDVPSIPLLDSADCPPYQARTSGRAGRGGVRWSSLPQHTLTSSGFWWWGTNLSRGGWGGADKTSKPRASSRGLTSGGANIPGAFPLGGPLSRSGFLCKTLGRSICLDASAWMPQAYPGLLRVCRFPQGDQGSSEGPNSVPETQIPSQRGQGGWCSGTC